MAAATPERRHQAVVDIATDSVVRLQDTEYDSLILNYYPNHSRIMFYTSECWKLFVGNTQIDLTGGPLRNSHSLYEIHGHWGAYPEFCCEHTVDQRRFAGELHLLHTNNGDECVHPTAAKNYQDPRFRAVICVFLEVGEENEELAKITDMLIEVRFQHDRLHSMTDDLDVDPFNLLPDNLEYWTYDELRGKKDVFDRWLFTGELDVSSSSSSEEEQEDNREKVTYIIFKTPIEVSPEQLKLLYPLPRGTPRGYDYSDISPIREGVARRQYGARQ